MASLRGLCHVVSYSFARQARSTKFYLCTVFLVILGGLAAYELRFSGETASDAHAIWHSHSARILVVFFLPATLASIGTAALGDEFRDRTWVYLASRPLDRSGLYLAKLVAALPFGLLMGVGGLGALCLAAPTGESWRIFGTLAPTIALGTCAYLTIFHVLALVSRHAMLVAAAYIFFFELFLANVPGLIKRLSVRFHISSSVYDVGVPLGIRAPTELVNQPGDGDVARTVLIGISVVALVLGSILVRRREFRE